MPDNQIIDFKDPLWITAWLETALKMEKEKYERSPVVPDMVPGHEAAQGWGYVVAGYFLVEESLKAILYVRGKHAPTKHSLSTLFCLLCDEDQETLRDYFVDYRATIGGRRGAFPFAKLDDFLVNLDGDKNRRGDHIGSFDWRYFLIEEKRSREMPTVSVDYLHEIVYGCLQIMSHVRHGRIEPRRHTRSWRLHSQRHRKYHEWLTVRMNSQDWHDLGDRLEILWGPDYLGRCDMHLFKGRGMNNYFAPIPDECSLPVVDKRQQVANLITEEGRRRIAVREHELNDANPQPNP